MTIGIHFFGADSDRESFPIAAALNIGKKEAFIGADNSRYYRLYEEAPKRWKATSADEADLLVYPYPYSDSDEVSEAVKLGKSLKKPCILFELSDSVQPCEVSYGLVCRNSIEKSTIKPCERAFPAFSDDVVAQSDSIPSPITKIPKPSVSFCGFVGSPYKRLFYRLQNRAQKVRGLSLREESMRRLEKDRRITTDFIRRTAFWGGALGRNKKPSPESRLKVRQEYLQNMANSPYVLCLRGAGNFSYRFYETLSMGRIPLFINTDCALPFENSIDWKRHVVWIEEDEISQLADKLLAFHESISESDFLKLQSENRKLWEDYLRPVEAYEQLFIELLGNHL